jgi:hypothetical protein
MIDPIKKIKRVLGEDVEVQVEKQEFLFSEEQGIEISPDELVKKSRLNKKQKLLNCEEEEEEFCWGCANDLGAQNSDLKTKDLYKYFSERIFSTTEKNLYQKIHDRHFDYFL